MGDKHDIITADERGFVLVGALLILLLLVLIGVAATTSTTLELQMAASHRARALAFYGAEAGQSFAWASPALTGSGNTAEDVDLVFPTEEQLDENANVGQLGAAADQSFQGTVTYEGPGPLPAGAGYSEADASGEGGYVAHIYRIESTGRGPNNAEVTVAVQGYRVGF